MCDEFLGLEISKPKSIGGQSDTSHKVIVEEEMFKLHRIEARGPFPNLWLNEACLNEVKTDLL